ncbi:DUF998 domain-containing protein [Micromonospora sp. NPDC047738]|uniref:DUF998 domain-containing protein n=1 Tax=unclassified Micromonospora TaxID=2617518 RepID=UPI0034090047
MRIHRLGSYSWLLATPLFLVANVITGLAWRQPRFSWATHNISDLGNVTCGVWDSTRPREVCSPWHAAMNGAMIVTGLLLALGVLLTWSALGRGLATRAAQVLTLAGAGGYVLAGAYPADVHENNHFLAALLIFVLGNVGMLVASLARRSPILGAMREDSLALGLTGLAGTALFLAQVDLGFGVGGMERVAVFPLMAWTVALAVRLTRTPPVADRLLC